MSDHEYTPHVAFELLMRKLAERDHALAEHVRAVVNQGRDMQETESSNRGRNKKYRVYRKTVPYPYDEALQVALDALAACFIEQPLFVESCLDNMAKAPVGRPKDFRYAKSSEDRTLLGILPGTEMTEKDVRIELRTETQLSTEIEISPSVDDTQPLRRFPADAITEQRTNLRRLKALLDFHDQ
jgi:hypothetical protein